MPIYSEDLPKAQVVFVEEEPLPLQHEFASIRQAFNDQYVIVTVGFERN